MRRVTLYTGPGCSLCDKAEALILKVAAEVPLTLEKVDISSQAELNERYRLTIPVVAIDGEVALEGKISEFWLRKALAGEPISRFKLF